MLHDSSHENIVKLLAVCSKSENTKNIGFLVTEYLDWVSQLLVCFFFILNMNNYLCWVECR